MNNCDENMNENIYELNILMVYEIFQNNDMYHKFVSITKGVLSDLNISQRVSQIGLMFKFLLSLDFSKLQVSDNIMKELFSAEPSTDYNQFLKYAKESINSNPSSKICFFLLWSLLTTFMKFFKKNSDVDIFKNFVKPNSELILNFLLELRTIHNLKYDNGYLRDITPEEWEEIRNPKTEEDITTEEQPQ